VVLKVKDGFSIFAVFYVFAQSLERLLEPVSRQWEIKDVEKEEEKATNAGTKLKIAEVAAASAMVSAPAAAPEAITQAEAAAGEKVAANRAKAVINANKEVFLWGMATAIAALVCGALGIRFLETLVEVPQGSSGGFRFMDLALTALVIGSGTKPLHDLIDRVQKPKPATT
jgi:hypothetical protein